MFSTFYKIKERNQKIKQIQNTFAILLENAPYLCLCVSLWLAQSHTSFNTAVSMAFCSSGEKHIKTEKKNVEKNEGKHRWLRWGRAGQRKGYTEVQYCTPCLSQLSCLCHNSFNFLPPPKFSLPLEFGW